MLRPVPPYTLIPVVLLATLLGCSAVPAAGLEGKQEERSKRAEEAVWRWSDAESNVLHSVCSDGSKYTIELVKVAGRQLPRSLTIRFVAAGRAVHTLDAHAATVFVIAGDELVYADYNPSASGCELVAVDLRTGVERWRTPLQGVGDVSHSEYMNRVAMRADGDAIEVFGNESAGKYVEYVDVGTGRSTAHKLFVRSKAFPTE